MKKRNITAVGIGLALVMLTAAASQAQPVTGPYISLGGGASLLQPEHNSFSQGGSTVYQAQTNFRADYATIAAIGYGLGNGIRVEVSGNFDRNTASSDNLYSITSGSSARLRTNGAEEKYGPMVNVLYDVSLGLPVYPYAGAGLGYQWVKFNRDLSVQGLKTGGTKGSLAYDVIGGFSVPLPVSGLSLTAEYRFMQTIANRNYPVNQPGVIDHFGMESSHSFLLGLRYQLFSPPPMVPAATPVPVPAAAPAPMAGKTYLVFFDWNKSSLTPRATEIIAQAAADSHTNAVTRLDVSGYTDTSGRPVYNKALSLRRAKAVAARLMADGVPGAEISVMGFGQTHLLVPTGPGVREPQNRRVEIVLK